MLGQFKQSGSGLLSAIVGVGVVGILATGMASVFSGSFKAQDSLRSNADLEEIKRDVRLMLSRPLLCEKSGIVGLTLDPNAPESTLVVLKSPATGGIMLKENASAMGSNWTTTKLRFTNMTDAGASSYLANLRFDGAYRVGGSSSSSVSKDSKNAAALLPIDFSLILTLDGANKVVSCGSSGVGPITCPGSQALKGINPNGTPICRPVLENKTTYTVTGWGGNQFETPKAFEYCFMTTAGANDCGRCTVYQNANKTWTIWGADCHPGHYQWCAAECYNPL